MKCGEEKFTAVISFPFQTAGHSVRGTKLRVLNASGACRTLVIAGIHGEEPETVLVLSRALRLLKKPSIHCAVLLAANPDGLVDGTRCNARGVDINRNFPAKNWSAAPVLSRPFVDEPATIELSPGQCPASEPETRCILELVCKLKPESILSIHAPLACVDDPSFSSTGKFLAEHSGLPLVKDVGYACPGSLGSWAKDKGIAITTLELPKKSNEELMKEWTPILENLLRNKF